MQELERKQHRCDFFKASSDAYQKEANTVWGEGGEAHTERAEEMGDLVTVVSKFQS